MKAICEIKHSMFPSASPMTDYLQRSQLLDVYVTALSEYAQAVTELRLCVLTSNSVGFDSIQARADAAFVRSRIAESDLKKHMQGQVSRFSAAHH